MNNKVFDGASKVVSFFKQLRLERILVVALASVLVFVSTACSPSSPEVSGKGVYHERANQPVGMQEYTDRADGKRRPGLNSYNDYGQRGSGKAGSGLEDAAKARVKQAEQNLSKVQEPKEFARSYREGTPLNERARNVSEDVGNAAKQFGNDVSEGTKDNLSNLKSNLNKASQNVQESTNYAQDRAQDAANAVRNRT